MNREKIKMKKVQIKLYKVTFNHYTDSTNMTVYNDVTDDYLDIPFGGLIIHERAISKYMNYGNGIKTLEFVGTIIGQEDPIIKENE